MCRIHPKKIAFLFAAMRKFARQLRDDGWEVRYSRLDDDGDRQKAICAEFECAGQEWRLARTKCWSPTAVKWPVIEGVAACPVKLRMLRGRPVPVFAMPSSSPLGRGSQERLPDGVFLSRKMRRKTGLLMEEDQTGRGPVEFRP